jgi:hypothetical protein
MVRSHIMINWKSTPPMLPMPASGWITFSTTFFCLTEKDDAEESLAYRQHHKTGSVSCLRLLLEVDKGKCRGCVGLLMFCKKIFPE